MWALTDGEGRVVALAPTAGDKFDVHADLVWRVVPAGQSAELDGRHDPAAGFKARPAPVRDDVTRQALAASDLARDLADVIETIGVLVDEGVIRSGRLPARMRDKLDAVALRRAGGGAR